MTASAQVSDVANDVGSSVALDAAVRSVRQQALARLLEDAFAEGFLAARLFEDSDAAWPLSVSIQIAQHPSRAVTAATITDRFVLDLADRIDPLTRARAPDFTTQGAAANLLRQYVGHAVQSIDIEDLVSASTPDPLSHPQNAS